MKVYSNYQKAEKRKRFRFVSTKRVALFFLGLTTIILTLLKVATWLNAEEMFLLDDIIVEGNYFSTKEDILAMVDIDTNSSLFEFDLNLIAAQVKRHPFVDDAWVSRRLPDNLVIHVEEKQPIALLNGTELKLINESGEFLPDISGQQILDFPVISNLSDNQSVELQKVLDYLHHIKNNESGLYKKISEIFYSKKIGIYFTLIEEATPVIVGEGGYYGKGGQLMQVLNILHRNKHLKNIEYFDLRYTNQVVVKQLLNG